MAVLVILDHLHRLHHLHHLLTKMTKITHPPGIGKNADLDYQDYVLSCLPTTITKMTATLLNVPSVYRLTKITKITVILLGMTVPFCRHIAAVSLFMPGLVEVRNSNGPDNHGVSDSRTICGLQRTRLMPISPVWDPGAWQWYGSDVSEKPSFASVL